jgi:hypothetical protein
MGEESKPDCCATLREDNFLIGQASGRHSLEYRTNTHNFIEPINKPHIAWLLMGESMQYFYEHHVPKMGKVVAPRINLTLRISDFSVKKSYAPTESILL